MTDLRIRLLKVLEFDDNKCAQSATEASELFEQYFNYVEPQPMGTPKQIFRMGYAQGAKDFSNSKLDLALADVVEALEDLKNDIECRGDAYWLVCRTIAKLEERLKEMEK